MNESINQKQFNDLHLENFFFLSVIIPFFILQ